MVGLKPTEIPPSAPIKFLSAGTAACIADLCTFPLDTAKVRLQIQGESRTCKASRQVKYKGVLGTITTMVKMEGPKSLYKGLVAGLQRQMSFASVRIGLYDSVKDLYTPKGSEYQHIHPSFLAGCTTGAMAVTCAQPTDVVKVRFQAHIQLVGRSTEVHTRDQGVRGLWKGACSFPKAILESKNLVTYDLIKETSLKYHLMTVRNLFGKIPTFFILGKVGWGGQFCIIGSRISYVSLTSFKFPYIFQYMIAYSITVASYPPFSYFSSFIPSFLRLGSWNVVMFVSYEQLKRLMVLAQVSWEAPF
uniref:Uncharacterized protein n=1 Tax=Laticauda laticaudata TaxID=8630 RepID=A0A8C5RL32_LATLA